MEIVSFGCWFESLFRIEELVDLLAQRQAPSIKQLQLASIKNSETHAIAGRSDRERSLSPLAVQIST